MATIKSFTSLEQSRKLAKILPLESADMTLPFRHPKNDEYIPGYVASRNYVEVYNEMMKLPAMEKEDVCKLIKPSWSFAALLSVLHYPYIEQNHKGKWLCRVEHENTTYIWEDSNPVDACYEVIIKLNELNLL